MWPNFGRKGGRVWFVVPIRGREIVVSDTIKRVLYYIVLYKN